MTQEMSDFTPDVNAENALIDAQQLAEAIDRNFRDADIPQYREHGIDLMLGAETYVRIYKGKNSFMNGVLKKRLNHYNRLTAGQARAALNIMRQELGVTENASDAPSTIKCFNCEYEAPTWDDLQQHKREMHGSREKAPEVFTDTGEAKAVIEDTTSVKGLDLSNLPDGRYALPDTSGKNEYIFIMVKRVRRTHKRDRRYIYGKIITGNEVVVAGTIEVKLWSSDSKELVGEQKPGDVYRGKLETELELCLMNPEPFAILFGKISEHCCICGKTLTDDESRAIGMGLECEKKEAYFKKPPKYSFIGQDRPDQEKANPDDQLYLEGKLRSYREPPKSQPN